jgi:hypothetical protein
MKRYIEEEIVEFDSASAILGGNLCVVLERLKQLSETYNKYANLFIVVQPEYNGDIIRLYGERFETDAEYNKRIALEKKEQKREDDAKARHKLKKEAQEKHRKEHNDKFKQIREAFNLPPELDLRTLKNALEVIG